jgi:sugar phosphate isomerase/epimerase
LAEQSPSSRLGIALAPYHLPQEPLELARLIEDLGPRLVHFYAWQHGRGCHRPMLKVEELEQMPGRGPLDFRPLLAALQKIGYQGWTEIFMHPTPRGIPILETIAEVTSEINRAGAYLEKCGRPL